MEKLEVARRQLGMATSLFIDNLDAVSVHTLACAAREIIERVCSKQGSPSIVEKIAVDSDVSVAHLRELANQYARALKHYKSESNDADLLASFSDQQNDFILFIAWSDYRRLTGAMPVEAQAVYVWVEAMYPQKMSIARDFEDVPPLVGIANLDRIEQKRRLQETVKLASSMKWLVDHDETERRRLVVRA